MFTSIETSKKAEKKKQTYFILKIAQTHPKKLSNAHAPHPSLPQKEATKDNNKNSFR